MPRSILKGSTDVIEYIRIRDSVTGIVETGFDVTTLDFQYTRNGEAPSVKADVIALAATDSDHADNKAIEIDATNSPGLCRVDFPDAAFADGVDEVILSITGAGFDPIHKEIQLVDYDPNDGVRLGLTALPNAVADAAGGLPISDAGGLDIDAILADTALLDKWLKNKIEFSGTSMVLYDDDGTTPLLTWTLSEGSTTVSGPYNRAKAT